jgi:uncharacterized oxidoreductase
MQPKRLDEKPRAVAAMNLSGNTILITGGTSGIGFALAARFMALGNTVIVTGVSQAQLRAARQMLPGVHAIKSDVSDPVAIAGLHQQVTKEFSGLNMLINNAGIMRKINLRRGGYDLNDITREIEICLNGPIRMVAEFLAHLAAQKCAAIINVSSGLAFVPLAIAPVYCAAKAAIHSFTQSLGIQLKDTNIAVFELAPPITRTALFRGDLNVDDVGVKPMDVETLVSRALAKLERDRLEIRPGLSNMLKLMSRVAPGFMARQLGKSADHVLAQPPGQSR